MTVTRDQERAALDKIKKIVADLGQDSYVGAAFEGVFEIAEQNIEDDAAFSCKAYRDAYYSGDGEKIALKEALATQRDRADRMQSEIDILTENRDAISEALAKRDQEFGDVELALSDAETEIVRLKAEAYDLMRAMKGR